MKDTVPISATGWVPQASVICFEFVMPGSSEKLSLHGIYQPPKWYRRIYCRYLKQALFDARKERMKKICRLWLLNGAANTKEAFQIFLSMEVEQNGYDIYNKA